MFHLHNYKKKIPLISYSIQNKIFRNIFTFKYFGYIINNYIYASLLTLKRSLGGTENNI